MGLTIDSTCSFCDQPLKLLGEKVTMAECPSCLNINRVLDGFCFKSFQYDIKGKLRLSKAIPGSSLRLDDNIIPIDGVIEIEYNEASIYFFFNYDNGMRIISLFEYEWYEVSETDLPVNKLNIKKLKIGEYASIFNHASSYVINKDAGREFSFSGQVDLTRYKESVTFVEHALEAELYLSLFEDNLHLRTFHLKPVTTDVTLTKNFTHYPVNCSCSKCNKQTNIESFPFTKSYICQCGAAHSIDKYGNADFVRMIPKYTVPFIELFSTCVIDEWNYRVIGHTEKEDSHGFSWNEFTLWNPTQGFKYLSVYKGHWILMDIEKLKHYIPTNRSKIQKFVYEDSQEFALFNDYKSTITKCKGSFAGNVLNDRDYIGIEYISPPHMWAFEKPENESVTVFKGRHISESELNTAYDGHIQFGTQAGVGAIQPVRGSVPVNIMIGNFVLAVALFILVQFLSALSNNNQLIFEGSRTIGFDSITKLTTPIFRLEKDHSNLSLLLKGSLNNSWLENEIEIINVDNGETINLEQGVEYYSGYEDGYSWSEGNTEDEKIISYLPKGNYQVSMQTSFDTYVRPAGYQITITNDVTMYKNLILILLFLAVPSLIYGIYVVNSEKERWSNSDYNPYE